MSNVIKSLSLVLLLSFTQTNIVMADELKVLTLKEFQEIKNSAKLSKENLAAYEINNTELITLQKFDLSKKNNKRKNKLKSLSIVKLSSI